MGCMIDVHEKPNEFLENTGNVNLLYSLFCFTRRSISSFPRYLPFQITNSDVKSRDSEAIVKKKYSRTRIKETRMRETFGYKKRFHSSAFTQD